MNQNRFWLASNSPRRREILSWAGWQLEKVSSDADESLIEWETPEDYVRRIALLKCRVEPANVSTSDFIIAADTIVSLDGAILGKPESPGHAEAMLTSMRARQHWVMTAIAVRQAGSKSTQLDLCKSQVKMRGYSAAEINAYVASGDPMDKAGAYAIQNREFHPAEDFGGCLASVMGMPLCHLERSLRRNSQYDWTDWPAICQEKLDYHCPVTSRIMVGEDIG